MKSLNQKGFSVLAVFLVVAVVVIVGLVGYRVVNNKKVASDNSTTTPAQANVQVPAKINNKSDLQQTGKALDSQTVDKDLDGSQLNADLNAL